MVVYLQNSKVSFYRSFEYGTTGLKTTLLAIENVKFSLCEDQT